MNVGSPFIASPQPSELVQPCEGSLHYPPMDAAATPLLSKAFGQDRLDPQQSQRTPVGFRVISSVSLNLVWWLAPVKMAARGALGTFKPDAQSFLKGGAEGGQRRRVLAFYPGHCGTGIQGQEPGDFLW